MRSFGRAWLQRLAESASRSSLWAPSLFGLALALPVVYVSGVCDDAMISFRYADNFSNGHGLVFNVNERVQGFTHPLWLLLLTPGLAALEDPIYVSSFYAFVLTLAFGFVMAKAIFDLAADRRTAAAVLVLLALVLLVSETWWSFQGLGLENPLSGLLITFIAIELWRVNVREVRLAFLCTFLGLTRPDLLLIVLPLAAVVAIRAIKRCDRAHLAALCLATAPLVLWAVFATIYYGDLVPNTANAKLGNYATLSDAARQGLRYLIDWGRYEPVSVSVTMAGICAGLLWARDVRQRALVIGLVLYAIYVVLIGGDFMRGRLFLPVFVGAVTCGSLILARQKVSFFKPTVLAPALGAILLAGIVVPPTTDASISEDGIESQYRAYDGYRLRTYLKDSKLTNRGVDLELAATLKAYAADCGPIALRTFGAGTMGYLSGPDVAIIERVGLTDKFIADLPRTSLWREHPRPGHPYKWIPVSYLAERGELSFIDGWQEAVETGDCSFRENTALFLDSDEVVLLIQTLPLPKDVLTGASLSVQPAIASPGDTVELFASGLAPEAILSFTVLGNETGIRFTANESGEVVASLDLPVFTPEGPYTIGLRDESGKVVTSTVTIE